MPPLSPGQVSWALVDGDVRRRVVILSREELNRGAYVVVVPTTCGRYQERRHLPNCVPILAGEPGFTEDCVIQAEAVTMLPKTDLDLEGGILATLGPEVVQELIRAVGYVIEADCQPL